MSFDDPIGLLPEISEAEWAERVTVRHLLAQHVLLPVILTEEHDSFEKDSLDCFTVYCALGAQKPILSEPGKLWSYGVGWGHLARLIEVLTDSPWEEAMREELFEPLGMSSTGLSYELDPNSAASHYALENGVKVRRDPEPKLTSRLDGPWGGIRSTISDLIAFGRVHVDDTSAFAKPGVLAQMRDLQSPITIPGWLDGWGLGWAKFNWKGGPVWGWDGLEGVGRGHRAILRILPEQRGVIALLSNTSSGRALYRSLFPLLLERYFGMQMPSVELRKPKLSPGSMARYAGNFGWPHMKAIVEDRSDHLEIKLGDERMDAFPVGENWFLMNPEDPDYALAFTFKDFGPDGRPRVMYTFLQALPRLS